MSLHKVFKTVGSVPKGRQNYRPISYALCNSNGGEGYGSDWSTYASELIDESESELVNVSGAQESIPPGYKFGHWGSGSPERTLSPNLSIPGVFKRLKIRALDIVLFSDG